MWGMATAKEYKTKKLIGGQKMAPYVVFTEYALDNADTMVCISPPTTSNTGVRGPCNVIPGYSLRTPPTPLERRRYNTYIAAMSSNSLNLSLPLADKCGSALQVKQPCCSTWCRLFHILYLKHRTDRSLRGIYPRSPHLSSSTMV